MITKILDLWAIEKTRVHVVIRDNAANMVAKSIMPVSLNKLYERTELGGADGYFLAITGNIHRIVLLMFSPVFKRTHKSSIFMTGSLRYSVTIVDRLNSTSTADDDLLALNFW